MESLRIIHITIAKVRVIQVIMLKATQGAAGAPINFLLAQRLNIEI